jgi:hypothetical protein
MLVAVQLSKQVVAALVTTGSLYVIGTTDAMVDELLIAGLARPASSSP